MNSRKSMSQWLTGRRGQMGEPEKSRTGEVATRVATRVEEKDGSDQEGGDAAGRTSGSLGCDMLGDREGK